MAVEAAKQQDSALGRFLKRVALLRESPVGMIGAALVLFWVLVAIFAPLISPYDPNENYVDDYGNWGPSAMYWLGRDNQGRDILSRLIWGSRIVLTVGPIATFCAYVVGCTMGLLAGYYRGWVDVVVSRISDIILSFPVIILYLIIISVFGPSAFNIVLAGAGIGSAPVARHVRRPNLELRRRR